MGLIDIITGPPITNSDNLEMKIIGNKVQLTKIDNINTMKNFNFYEKSKKFDIRIIGNVQISPNSTINVRVNSNCDNNLIIPAQNVS